MKYTLIFFLLFFNNSFAIQNAEIPKNLEIKLDKVLKEYFGGSFGSKEKIIFSIETQHNVPLILKIRDLKSHTIGFAYLGKAKSKIALFDYVVIFDKNIIITQIKVLIYREDHGGEINSKRWLQQFLGFEKNQDIVYKKDIAGISGATISASSLTQAVNNDLKIIGKLYQLNQL